MRRGVGRFGTLALTLALGACSNSSETPPKTKGNGTVKSVSTVVSGGTTFRVPFDAALSPDGKTVYFTALVGEGAALLSSPVMGGSATKVADLVGPGSLDVTADGRTVVAADPGVESSAGALGALVSVSASGGTPAVLSGTEGTLPRGVSITGNRIVFTGVDPADGTPGVFETTTGGGRTTLLKTGLIDPSGVSAGAAGEVYVLDADSDGSSTRRIIKVASGAGTELVKGLRVGFPSGLALAENGLTLVVASTDPATGKARFERFGLSGASAGAPAAPTIGSFDEPAGLHRAALSDSYAYVDSGASGSGSVFVVNPQ